MQATLHEVELECIKHNAKKDWGFRMWGYLETKNITESKNKDN
jgi:hypothetical protein